MANPNWVNFPGLPNTTTDSDGRPQVLDLIPGKQSGTLLEALLFNSMILALCGLRDAVDAENTVAISGVLGLLLGESPGLGLRSDGTATADNGCNLTFPHGD